MAAVLVLGLGIVPARAAVTATFWSHEFGKSFPHAFISLRGVPDAGGAPVDAGFGFTARSLTPTLLFRSVRGVVELPQPAYVEASDAQFSVILTDEQYARMVQLVAAWSDNTGDSRYSLNERNCVHFVKEAARIAGVRVLDFPALMKKPRSYLLAVVNANPGKLIKIGMRGREYLASLPPITAKPVVDVLPPTAPVPAPVY